jgi:hypothetical protein
MSLESIARDLRLKRAFLLRGAFIVESHKTSLKCDVLENFQNSTSRVITRHPRAREPLSIEKKRAALSRTEAGGGA